MANYCCAIRTNYFRVRDPEKFKEFMMTVCAEDRVDVWEKEVDGTTLYGFGCYGSIYGVRENNDWEEDDDSSYDKFIDGLMSLVAEDDAIIIFESGNEKLRYVVGSAEIVTSKSYECVQIENVAIAIACNMIGNQNWSTSCCY